MWNLFLSSWEYLDEFINLVIIVKIALNLSQKKEKK